MIFFYIGNDNYFLGALLLQREQESTAEPYVRCVEIHPLPGKKEFHLVICMSPPMAFRLLMASRISIDTSFKRLHGWEEFEIEAWDNDHMRCKTFIYLSF